MAKILQNLILTLFQNRKLHLSLFLALFCAMPLIAQDIHFSQYYYSPLNLNPATTGLFEEDCRFTAIYRSQWSSIAVPFVTLSASYEIKKNIGEDVLGIGGMLFNDRSGTVRFEQTSIYPSVSYQKRLNENFLSFGLQPGFMQKKIRNDISFDEDYDNSVGSFNAGLASAEQADLPPPVNNFDINGGVAWLGKAGLVSYTIGAGIFHILEPNESFIEGGDVPLNRKYGLHGDAIFPMKEGRFALNPSLMMMIQGQFTEAVAGLKLMTDFAGKKLDFGAFFRKTSVNTDAAIIAGSLGFNNIKVGLSYDVNISSLINATESYGGFEIGIIYVCPATLLETISIPCERY